MESAMNGINHVFGMIGMLVIGNFIYWLYFEEEEDGAIAADLPASNEFRAKFMHSLNQIGISHLSQYSMDSKFVRIDAIASPSKLFRQYYDSLKGLRIYGIDMHHPFAEDQSPYNMDSLFLKSLGALIPMRNNYYFIAPHIFTYLAFSQQQELLPGCIFESEEDFIYTSHSIEKYFGLSSWNQIGVKRCLSQTEEYMSLAAFIESNLDRAEFWANYAIFEEQQMIPLKYFIEGVLIKLFSSHFDAAEDFPPPLQEEEWMMV